MRYWSIMWILIGYGHHLFGQYTIDTVEISADRPFAFSILQPDAGYSDSLYIDIIQYLQDINGTQVQNSTPGGLTTLLHRGLGNRHLPILWHGINLQSIVNGSMDLSLIPAFLMDDIRFYRSGNTALAGNNGLAGALVMDPSSIKQNGSKILLKASSLLNYDAGVVYRHMAEKWRFKLGVQSGYHLNKYSYTYNRKKLDRQTTDFLKNDVMTSISYQLAPHTVIIGDLWWQNSDRIIPESITSGGIIQKQKDINTRTRIGAKHYGNKHIWETSFAYANEKLHFMTPGVDSKANTDIFIINTGWTEIHKESHYFGLQHRSETASPNFYTETKYRNTTQLSGAKNFNWETNFMTHISFRQDLTDGKLMPLSWTLLNKYRKLTVIFSSNYNLPGLNDLYWPVGGNPDLKTEKALKGEIQFSPHFKQWRGRIAVYANMVRDWIQWVPQSNGNWAATNQKKVLSRGVELQAHYHYPINTTAIDFHIEYAFNRTTALEHYYDPSLIGKQLIYIPRHKASLSTDYSRHHWRFHLAYDFTDVRFDAADESSFLKAYHLVSAYVAREIGATTIRLDVNNLLNQDYSIVRFFPNPGIHAELSAIIRFY